MTATHARAPPGLPPLFLRSVSPPQPSVGFMSRDLFHAETGNPTADRGMSPPPDPAEALACRVGRTSQPPTPERKRNHRSSYSGHVDLSLRSGPRAWSSQGNPSPALGRGG